MQTEIATFDQLETWEMAELNKSIFGCLHPFKVYAEHDEFRDLVVKHVVRCKRCDMCKERKKKEWAGRIVAESNLHAVNSFVTLTYDEDNVPPDLETGYRDVQKWLKRLRKNPKDYAKFVDGTVMEHTLPPTLRFFAAGEFGPKADRPHWHLVVFGMPPMPKPPHLPRENSKMLLRSWQRGFVTWEPADVSRMKYAACYSVKKSDQHLSYCQMSNRPGLGALYAEKLGKQAYRRGILPQSIPSLRVGKTHFPLDQYMRGIIENNWLIEATAAGDRKLLNEYNSRRRYDIETVENKKRLYEMEEERYGWT